MFDLSATMDAIAARCVSQGVCANAIGYPIPTLQPPMIVVGYPTKLDYDLTFHSGATTGKVKLAIPLWYVVGKVIDKAARDALSTVISTAVSIKAKLDGDSVAYGGILDYVNVDSCSVETLMVGDVDYLAAKFELEVVA